MLAYTDDVSIVSSSAAALIKMLQIYYVKFAMEYSIKFNASRSPLLEHGSLSLKVSFVHEHFMEKIFSVVDNLKH